MLTGTLYPPPGAPLAGSKPRPAEKPGKPENTYRQQYTSPRGTSVSNPSKESSINSIRKATDKYANAMQGIKATTEIREPKDRNNSSTTRSDQRRNRQWARAANKPNREKRYGSYPLSLRGIRELPARPRTYHPGILKSTEQVISKQCTNDNSTEHTHSQAYNPCSILRKLKGRNFTYHNKLGAKSDAYANKLHKGDVFAHLTSFKKTFEKNIQTKHLSKRIPTLPLSLSSELPTAGNQRR
ncbi:hypothetical protein F511_17724 [Dorcoceras hygrometricum]|uniref:Uncharacterized protein n=1 Tax=Dorcoceras hygrometricum TaxID=472368 RepID=A0A2Z7BJJ0_9LAMI|nr:hypothetical protein F511_17724 [Dorcoceras hygrometricum]